MFCSYLTALALKKFIVYRQFILVYTLDPLDCLNISSSTKSI